MSNLNLLKQGYKDFAVGNVAGAVSNWQSDIVWEQCTGFPFVKEGGIYVGVQNIIEGVFAKIPEYYDGFNIEITDYVDGGDRIVMIGYYAGTWKATGKKFKAHAAHAWTFKNGKATHFYQVVDTAEIMNP